MKNRSRMVMLCLLCFVLALICLPASAAETLVVHEGNTGSISIYTTIDVADSVVVSDSSIASAYISGKSSVVIGEEPNRIVRCAFSVSVSGKENGTTNIAVYGETGLHICDIVVDVTAHEWDEGKCILESSCTEQGSKLHTCKLCFMTKETPINSLGHDKGEWVTVNVATCSEMGTSELRCTRCSNVLDIEKTPLADHDAGKWVTVAEPDCVNEGKKELQCTVCNFALDKEVIPAKGHVEGDWVVAKEATCKDDGLKELHCKACDAVLDTEVIAAAGVEHKPTDWVVTKEADCENDGSKQKTCTVCNAVLETEVIKALGHKAGEWEEVKAPTCTKEGMKEQKCTVCEELLKSEAVAALGHKAGEWAAVKAPTCTQEGTKEQKCTVCAALLAEETIPAVGHIEGEWVITKKPTRLEEGEKQLPCAVCGEVLAKESVPVLTVIDYSMTACSAGPRFRDAGVATDEWDMFTPVDLSADGEWKYDLIAGNTHVIGNVTVKVAGGKVTVDYVLNSKQMKVNSEFVTFLSSIGDVTTIKHDELKAYAFGQEIDIEDDLGGDTKVLLYVCNRILYDSDTNGVEHFSRDSISYNALCEELAQIMD